MLWSCSIWTATINCSCICIYICLCICILLHTRIIMAENCCGFAQFGAATITNMSENPIEMSFWTTQTENKVFSTYSESVKEIKKMELWHDSSHRQIRRLSICKLKPGKSFTCTSNILYVNKRMLFLFLEMWENNKLPRSNKLSWSIVHEGMFVQASKCWFIHSDNVHQVGKLIWKIGKCSVASDENENKTRCNTWVSQFDKIDKVKI